MCAAHGLHAQGVDAALSDLQGRSAAGVPHLHNPDNWTPQALCRGAYVLATGEGAMDAMTSKRSCR